MSRFLLILLTLSGCSSIKTVEPQHSPQQLNTSGEIEVLFKELARENCLSNTFNLCNDGFEQPYRLHPLIVELDKEDFLASYDTVFMFPPDYAISQLKAKGVELMDVWKMDLMFNSDSTNVLTYKNPAFCKKTKNYFKKNNISSDIQCQFSYKLYKMKIKVVYGGLKEIILPDFSKHHALVKKHPCEMYYITSIEIAEPVEAITRNSSVSPPGNK